MSEYFFSELGLLCYLNELRKEELWKFKEMLQQEALNLQLQPIPWATLKKADKTTLASLLSRHYPGKVAWELVLNLFLQIQRADLWARAQAEIQVHSCPYRNHIKEKFQRLWTVEARLPVPEHFYRESVETEYQKLVALCALSEGPSVVVLGSPEGMGKTTMLRKLMLDWAEGKVWRDRFSFVFLIECSELNQLSETSLEEILARDWPAGAEPLETALQHPKKVLFIADSLHLFVPDIDMHPGNCEHWQQRASPAAVLSHLLRQNLVPEATVLVTGDYKDRDIEKGFLGQRASYVTLPGFTELARKLYFSHFFRNTRHASSAFAYVESKSALTSLCSSPLVCWVICCCLQGQLARGQALKILCDSGTSLYLSFITSIFPRGAEGRSPMQNYARLRALCSLAAEGSWTGTYIFGREHMQRNGLTEADVQAWLGRRLLQQRGELVVFAHEIVQDFCASLLYVLQKPDDDGGITNPHIGSVSRLMNATLGSKRTTLSHLPAYIFGLTNEDLLSELEASLGCSLEHATRSELFASLCALAESPGPVKFQSLLNFLFETQDPEFTGEVMDLFPDLSIKIQSTEELILMSFCLRSCKKLKKLRFQLDPSFAEPAEEDRLEAWREFCVVFTNCADFSMLDVDGSTLDPVSLSVLFGALACQPHKLQWLACTSVTNLGQDLSFFNLLFHSTCLKHLNLYSTCLSYMAVEQLCIALSPLHCNVSELLLGKCHILKESCKDLALMLMSNKKMKLLSLVENPLMDDGVFDLCVGLKDPNCTLELLMLMNCCLSAVSCNHISDMLWYNKSLHLLDLSYNRLEDVGVDFLCQALMRPGTTICQLWLTSCYLSASSCRTFSSVLIHDNKLRVLKLGQNHLDDVGVQVLCRAMEHPNCKLEVLGLDSCELTSTCCPNLATALTSCRTLQKLNLYDIDLDLSGARVLCAALSDANCSLQILGLDLSEYDLDTQELLSDTEDNVPNLTIKISLWEEENRVRGVRE